MKFQNRKSLKITSCFYKKSKKSKTKYITKFKCIEIGRRFYYEMLYQQCKMYLMYYTTHVHIQFFFIEYSWKINS